MYVDTNKTKFLVKKPKFQLGEKSNKFTVIEYLGHFTTRKTSPEHHYLVKCECGNEEQIAQSRLYHRKDCRACAQVRRSGSVKKRKGYKKPPKFEPVIIRLWPVPDTVLKTLRYER